MENCPVALKFLVAAVFVGKHAPGPGMQFTMDRSPGGCSFTRDGEIITVLMRVSLGCEQCLTVEWKFQKFLFFFFFLLIEHTVPNMS